MTFKGIQAGDLVEYRNALGQVCSGRAQLLLLFPTHVVVSIKGTRGQPAVVNANNYLCHGRGSRKPT